jgi:uncharacterized protein (DUF433 family)
MPMPPKDAELLRRITTSADQCAGAPCVRGMRIRVSDVLSYLAGGDDERTVADHLAIEVEDVRACIAYAAQYLVHPRLVA